MGRYRSSSASGAGCLILGGCLAAAAAYFFGVPFLVMLAWNFVAPQFGGPQIDYLTAFAVMFLLGIVGSFFRGSVTVSRN